MRSALLLVFLAFFAWGSAGCVKAYQREYLSLRPMRPAAETSEDRFRGHYQTSREGSEGGFGSAGGGCGCN